MVTRHCAIELLLLGELQIAALEYLQFFHKSMWSNTFPMIQLSVVHP